MATIEETLKERGSAYGSFEVHADIECQLRAVMDSRRGNGLDYVMYAGLGMIMHKIARVLNEGSLNADSWHDIAGYALRVEEHVIKLNEVRAELQEILDER